MSEIETKTLLDQEKHLGKKLRVGRTAGFKAGGERDSTKERTDTGPCSPGQAREGKA